MDHCKGLSTVFNCWKFCFKLITQWWTMVDFVTQNGPIFYKIFKIFVVINQKLWDICCQKLVWVVSTIGTTNTSNFIKIREVTQNSLLVWHGMTPKQEELKNICLITVHLRDCKLWFIIHGMLSSTCGKHDGAYINLCITLFISFINFCRHP